MYGAARLIPSRNSALYNTPYYVTWRTDLAIFRIPFQIVYFVNFPICNLFENVATKNNKTILPTRKHMCIISVSLQLVSSQFVVFL